MLRAISTRLSYETKSLVRHGAVEHTIDFARTLFAAASLVAIVFDPTEPARFAPIVSALMLGYMLYSALLLLTSSEQPSSRRILVTYTVDLFWPAVMSAFTEGVNSPFFLFFILVLLTSAYRWGMFETLITSVVCILLLCVQSLLVVRVALGAGYGLNVTVMRSAYIVVIAVLIGFISQSEKQQREEERAISDLLAKAASKSSFRLCLYSVLEDLIAMTGADCTVVSMLDLSSKQFTIVELSAHQLPHQMLLQTADPAEFNLFNFMPDKLAGMLIRDEEVQIETHCIRAPSGFDARYKYQTMAAVPFDISSSLQGCAFVLNPREPRARATISLLTRALRRAIPVVYSNYLVKQLRHRAGAMERGRLARELHDGSIQSLSGAEMRLYVLRHALESNEQEALSSEVRTIQELVHAEIVNLRQLTHDIRPSEDVTDIQEALTSVVERFRDSGVAARYIGDAPNLVLAQQSARELVSITKEALTNVRKHSKATNAVVRLSQCGQSLELVIEDNGSGFDFVGRLSDEELRRSRHGPLVIKERVRALGGELAIESYPGRGARLEITLPGGVVALAE